MEIIFYLLALAIFYAYYGYPLFMMVLHAVKKCKNIERGETHPNISIVIPAYNEEASIRAKLENVLGAEYPRDNMELFIVSDASSDSTDDIVKEFESRGAMLHRMDNRSGKIAAYKSVLPKLKGDVIVFTDATSMLKKDSISNLISNFNDRSVGCVGGLLIYVNPDKAIVGEGENKYWDYEKRIRQYESDLCSLPSVSGTLYAIRRDLYPIDIEDDLADDLIAPITVFKAGYRTVLARDAICTESTTLSIEEDMAKRTRITVQNIRGLMNQVDILNPFKYGLFSIMVISHKIFRILVPIFLLLLFIDSMILSSYSAFFKVIFVSQIVFYVIGITGYLISKKVRVKIVNTVFYFCLANLAIILGIVKFCLGERVKTWETVRVSNENTHNRL